MLNSLYGKFGQKDLDSKIKIVSSEEAERLVKRYHYSYLAELDDGRVLIKFNAKLNEKIRQIYAKEENELNANKYNFKKERGVVSAVQISAFISAYARLSINLFKNRPDNPVIYSDTDSLVLPHPLDSSLVGPELGQWKLEAEIEKGIFIRPKLYAYYTKDGILKMVAYGVDAKKLSFKEFELLLDGRPVTTTKNKIMINWQNLEVKTYNQEITLKNIKPAYKPEGKTALTVSENKRAFVLCNSDDGFSELKKGVYAITVYVNKFAIVLYNPGGPAGTRGLTIYKNKQNKQNLLENQAKENKQVENQTKENGPAVIYLPAPTKFSEDISKFEKQFFMYNLLGRAHIDRNVYQAKIISEDIVKILNQLNELKPVCRDAEFEYINNNAWVITVKSKLFYRYGKAGKEISNQLKKYLSNLDFIDIYFLLNGTQKYSNYFW